MTDNTNENHYALFEAKMKEAGLSESAMKAFEHSYSALVSGQTGMILESDISPATSLDYLEGKEGDDSKKNIRASVTGNSELLKETVVLKLNGGLGTSMGLDKAKSLLTVKGNDTFLDLMAKQTIECRKTHSAFRFMLMNSFSTSDDTLAYLKAHYPDLASDLDSLELMQNKAPKVDAATLKPAENPSNPSKEWCPPGHGDLYPSLVGSGKLAKLRAEGYKYMFVSNSDNLGATMDVDLLTYFSESDASFLMECCERTENDKKGGHLAIRNSDGRLILRESAQCDDGDKDSFQNTSVHKYFNTNNLWVRLDRLEEELKANNGVIKLPVIKNKKTVDPQDSTSTPVFQLETAMGAAIECFAGATAVCVPRSRFVPVKKCDDLLMLRSDAYVVTPEFCPVLAPSCNNVAPIVSLDSKHFKLVSQLEEAIVSSNVPSLVACKRLKVSGPVAFADNVVFEGDVSIVNDSEEVKTVLTGRYANTTLNITDQPGVGSVLKSHTVVTKPIDGQKPGTSGLRKKTKTFMEEHYLENFVQSTLNALPRATVRSGTIVISGDGRFFNKEAIQIIVKMCVAAGVGRIWIGSDGLLSTPAVSAVIRNREDGFKAFGGFILSASHNPGGIDEDFGIKYNCENGGPAPESLTNAIYENTKTLKSFNIARDFPNIDLSSVNVAKYAAEDGSREVTLQVFDCAEDHVSLLKSIFDFDVLKKLISRKDFSMVYDSMHGVQGPYAKRVFVDELGASEDCLINGTPSEDFNKCHADPNLTYAVDLIKAMGVDNKGCAVEGEGQEYPTFGAAADGDADRNMILGSQFFVTPSDSLAIIVSYANKVIPYVARNGGLKGVARSMPTSGAVDLVASAMNLKMFEVPTGWKFFGNLMDSAAVYGKEDFTPFICGEESFGTGSNHIREKDGMWAVLAWLSILASENSDDTKALVSVQDIVQSHWKKYGRNYYCRYDYEGVDAAGAADLMSYMAGLTLEEARAQLGEQQEDGVKLDVVDEFTYVDPVDGSVSAHQGIRFIFEDKSRVIFRKSGTGVAGATIRMYIEKYQAPGGDSASLFLQPSEALGPLIQIGLKLSKLEHYVKRSEPTVIT